MRSGLRTFRRYWKNERQNMNRTFQSEVGKWYWAVVAVSSAALFYCFWEHHLWLTVLTGAAVVFEIEMLVHTRYVVTSEGELRIEGGRFVPNRVIQAESVCSVCRTRSRSFLNPALSFDGLRIEFGEGGKKETVFVSPKNRKDFVGCLLKKNPRIRADV